MEKKMETTILGCILSITWEIRVVTTRGQQWVWGSEFGLQGRVVEKSLQDLGYIEAVSSPRSDCLSEVCFGFVFYWPCTTCVYSVYILPQPHVVQDVGLKVLKLRIECLFGVCLGFEVQGLDSRVSGISLGSGLRVWRAGLQLHEVECFMSTKP